MTGEGSSFFLARLKQKSLGGKEVYAHLPKNEQGAPVYVEEEKRPTADRISELRGTSSSQESAAQNENIEKVKVRNKTYTIHKDDKDKPIAISISEKGKTYSITDDNIKGLNVSHTGEPLSIALLTDELKSGLCDLTDLAIENRAVDDKGNKIPEKSMAEKVGYKPLGKGSLQDAFKNFGDSFKNFGRDF